MRNGLSHGLGASLIAVALVGGVSATSSHFAAANDRGGLATMGSGFEIASSDSSDAARRHQVLRRVEQLLNHGRLQDAITFLEERLELEGYDREISRRLARLYRDARQWKELETLIEGQIEARGGEPEVSELRLLAEARFELRREDEAVEALQRIIELDPDEPSYARLVAGSLSRHGRSDLAIEILLEARERSREPRRFAQQLGTIYAERGMRVEASREYLNVIIESPLNVSLMRAQIMELTGDEEALDGIQREAESAVEAHPDTRQLKLVLAEIRQRNGDSEGAWDVIGPLIADPDMLQDLHQMAMAGISDARLPGVDPTIALNTLTLSQRVLKGLLETDHLPQAFQPRIYDTLNRTYLAMLSHEAFEELDSEDQARILGSARSTLLEMGKRFPGNRHTTASLLRLAELYVNALHRPQEAIPIYRSLQFNPNIGVEELQMARVGLGQAYMAAGDTTSARTLFDAMGKDMEFVEGQGRAHYQLGMLDFMGGEFDMAKDRLAAVAFEAPSAAYTNDALDLALLLAEELEGFNDQESLALYGRALYYHTTAETDSLRLLLVQLTRASSPGLAGRARLNLAELLAQQSEGAEAFEQIEILIRDEPESRWAPQAIELKGDLLVESGQIASAMATYETLLLEYEDYIFLDGVRDKLRELRVEAGDDTGGLP